MDRMLAAAGFAVKARRLLYFPGLDTVARRLGLARPWDHAWFVRLDHAVSCLTAWNARYWRPRLADKLAPRVAYWVAERI